jgi:diguanylate cyclase (GGDEF)-like protein
VAERSTTLTGPAGPEPAQVASVPKPRYPGPPPLGRGAKTHLALVGIAAIVVSVPLLARLGEGTTHWGRFVLLAVLTAGAQLYTVDRPGKQSYKTSIVFLIASAILLSPSQLVLVAALQYLPEWVRTRKKPTVMGFNIAKGVLDTLSAWGAYRLAADHLPLSTNNDLRLAVAGFIACFAYVTVNHLLLARMVSLAHGGTMRATQLFSFDYFTTDLFLAFLGVGVAALWLRAPYVIPLVIAPLVLTHRALSVPQLKAEARVDPKTGLSNARHFGTVFDDELARTIRYGRPLSLVMADLDLLRDINNTHGHLAGDAVLRGIAEIFGQQLRQYDLPSRFGGEEFCILLPETTPERAVEIADRIRRAVASTKFVVETVDQPIRATVSLGVSSYPRDGATTEALVNAADLAVYRAKLQGRDRVVDAPAALAPV